MRRFYLSWAAAFLSAFSLVSYLVKKQRFLGLDFDITVKLQDHISRRFDTFFSYFSILGSAEITTLILVIIGVLILVKYRKIFFGAVLFFAATIAEIMGKSYIPHPSPPQFLLRYDLGFSFPSFYVHTNFSYPSGHLTRTVFIITFLFFLAFRGKSSLRYLWMGILGLTGILMFISRIYLGEHWFSDVLGGTLLGIGSAFMALALY